MKSVSLNKELNRAVFKFGCKLSSERICALLYGLFLLTYTPSYLTNLNSYSGRL